MPDRIDTKAALAGSLPPNPANYTSDFQCMTMAIKRLEAIRGALAQEIADHEADRMIANGAARMAIELEAAQSRIEALESDKAAMRLDIVTIIGMYGGHMHPRVKQALEAVAVAYPNVAPAKGGEMTPTNETRPVIDPNKELASAWTDEALADWCMKAHPKTPAIRLLASYRALRFSLADVLARIEALEKAVRLAQIRIGHGSECTDHTECRAISAALAAEKKL